MPFKVSSDRIYTLVPQSSFDKLLDAFRCHICDPSQKLDIDMKASLGAWCRFAFSLISFGGLAGPRFFEEICNLKFKDIKSTITGHIMIPRWGGQVPLYVGELIACSALSLGIHLVRESSEELLPDLGYLIPGRNDPKSVPTKKERAEANTYFAAWLQALVKGAGIREKITLSRLAQLSRGRLTRIYSQPVAGAILGLHRYNPAPPYQSNLFGDYRLPLDLDKSLPNKNDEIIQRPLWHVVYTLTVTPVLDVTGWPNRLYYYRLLRPANTQNKKYLITGRYI